MATILITGGDFAAVQAVRGVAEGLGHSVIHAITTENIIEDVVLNDVALVIAAETSDPFNGWETCNHLRGEPSVPYDLAIMLMHHGAINPRRYSASGFSGKLNADAGATVWSEEIVRQLGDYAAPETNDPSPAPGRGKR